VYNSSGTLVASYTYTDAWGNQVVTYSNGGGSTGAQYNPFRYRGYYYDRDLVMYYLNSRYYDSKICRFINADSALYDATLGYNLFAYCENNPVMKYDTTGEYCVSNMDDDRNLLDDWIFEGAGGGGGGATSNYFGAGTAYNNYSVYSTTSAYNANLGGYYTSPLSSGITNPNYYYVPGAVSVTDSMATDGSSNTMDHSLSFKKEIDLETHFDKHANEFGDLYSTPQEYLNGANYVVNNGTYVPEMNGYVRFFGAKGRANYAFVGLTRDGMYITTFSVRSVVSLYKIPWIMP
ncbi:MAG: RHS repeat-associated core domain-containing protein, partial [Clostridia bacterium]|nr:RHS repeat-associated core domain-containing protein [Clostridia bacterium]